MKRMFSRKDGSFSVIKLIRNIFIVFILVVAAFFGKAYGEIQATLDNINADSHEVIITKYRDKDVDINAGEPINVLLIGTDANNIERTESDGFVSRSDSLILVNLNPAMKQSKIVSIPRDAMTLINGQPDKINHAYAYGGEEMTIEAIQSFLNIPIDYYASVNMTGLEALIDAVGGVTVTSPLTFEYRGTYFTEGETRTLNGVKAMNFARMRYDDPQGEIGRQARQKIVLKSLADKILDVTSIVNMNQILEVINDNVKTNVNLATAFELMQTYRPAMENISVVNFDNYEEVYLNGVFYFHIPLFSRVKVANDFRLSMNMKPIQIADLTDPIEDKGLEEETKKLAVVLNQYPTGLSKEQLDALNTTQGIIQGVRETEQYSPPTQTPRPVESHTPETSVPSSAGGNSSESNSESETSSVPESEESVPEESTNPVPTPPESNTENSSPVNTESNE